MELGQLCPSSPGPTLPFPLFVTHPSQDVVFLQLLWPPFSLASGSLAGLQTEKDLPGAAAVPEGKCGCGDQGSGLGLGILWFFGRMLSQLSWPGAAGSLNPLSLIQIQAWARMWATRRRYRKRLGYFQKNVSVGLFLHHPITTAP